MGSFSVSCALTGITLANQPAVLIPLAPARWPGGEGARKSPSPIGGAYVCTNEGAGALFGPLALPILGRVGDYGDLENYEEDDNVRFLKMRFGDQFDDFIEGCTRGGRTKLTDRLARKVQDDPTRPARGARGEEREARHVRSPGRGAVRARCGAGRHRARPR